MSKKRQTSIFAWLGFSLYFGCFLVPKLVPSFGATMSFLALLVSAVIVVPVLVVLAIWAGLGITVGTKSERHTATWRTAVAGLSALAGVVLLSEALPSRLPSGSYESEFDKREWGNVLSLTASGSAPSSRQRMLAAVVSGLPGKSRQQVEEELGPSLQTEYFQRTGRDLIYLLGPQRDSFMRIDSEWLLIWLDKTGNVQRYRVVND